MESVIYVIDVVLLLTLLTVSQGFVDAGAPDASYFQALGDSVLGARDWTGAVLDLTAFGLDPQLCALWGKTRASMAVGPGLAGASLYMAAGVMVMYGLEPLSTTQVVLEAPLGLQEMVLAIWLIGKGFNAPVVVATLDSEPVAARV